jgi:beta-glucuronidase
MLFPQESETRQVKDLSGLWRFKPDLKNVGIAEGWEQAPLAGAGWMPVPASYNDLIQEAGLRDHVGLVWYERDFWAPAEWQGKQVRIRVGSAAHEAVLYVNGRRLAEHAGGFLPFEAEAGTALRWGESNRLTIAVDNRLRSESLPPGQLVEGPDGRATQETFFDFYNYSGLHRPVRLVALPLAAIEDLTVRTEIAGRTGIVDYAVAADPSLTADVRLLEADGAAAAQARGAAGRLRVPRARLWAPGSPHLYTLEVRLSSPTGELRDCYRQPVGIRTVAVSGGRFLLNGEPFYFKGFGRHEDADLRGRGLDLALLVKDFNLMAWIGANSFRTSHYPYAEETMQMADRCGFLVIDEVPACGLNFWDRARTVFSEEAIGARTQARHLQAMRELIERDKNHPSVVLWSVGNEPASYEQGAGPYFEPIFDLCRQLDPSRPVTCVECARPEETTVAQHCDVLCVNRYFGWYSDPGRLDLAGEQLAADLSAWHERFGKPVLLSEFGADTIAGMHADPPVMFSEEYQVEFLRAYFAALDRLDFVVGEHVWNFADFATRQGITRMMGNRKGVFTRQRQPKAAAFVLKERWESK